MLNIHNPVKTVLQEIGRILQDFPRLARFLNQTHGSQRTPGFLKLLLSGKSVCVYGCVCVCLPPGYEKPINVK